MSANRTEIISKSVFDGLRGKAKYARCYQCHTENPDANIQLWDSGWTIALKSFTKTESGTYNGTMRVAIDNATKGITRAEFCANRANKNDKTEQIPGETKPAASRKSGKNAVVSANMVLDINSGIITANGLKIDAKTGLIEFNKSAAEFSKSLVMELLNDSIAKFVYKNAAPATITWTIANNEYSFSANSDTAENAQQAILQNLAKLPMDKTVRKSIGFVSSAEPDEFTKIVSGDCDEFLKVWLPEIGPVPAANFITTAELNDTPQI